MADQGRVEFLVEVSDPSEAAQFGYTVNGIPVSDFYTPHYFDPVQANGVRYSQTGAYLGGNLLTPQDVAARVRCRLDRAGLYLEGRVADCSRDPVQNAVFR
jgi:hypothetical protein